MMFVVFLRFFGDKGKAGQFMQAHNTWIQRGVDEGVFLLVGSLLPNAGGAIIAHNTTLADLEQRVKSDPFVEYGVVRPEVLEIKPNRTDQRLSFLLAP
jgi:uncharacterized protein YciI